MECKLIHRYFPSASQRLSTGLEPSYLMSIPLNMFGSDNIFQFLTSKDMNRAFKKLPR